MAAALRIPDVKAFANKCARRDKSDKAYQDARNREVKENRESTWLSVLQSAVVDMHSAWDADNLPATLAIYVASGFDSVIHSVLSHTPQHMHDSFFLPVAIRSYLQRKMSGTLFRDRGGLMYPGRDTMHWERLTDKADAVRQRLIAAAWSADREERDNVRRLLEAFRHDAECFQGDAIFDKIMEENHARLGETL